MKIGSKVVYVELICSTAVTTYNDLLGVRGCGLCKCQQLVDSQGRSQDFLKEVSKNSIKLPQQGSGGTAPSH